MSQTILTAFVEPTRYENPVLFVPAGLAAVSAITLAFRASKVLGRGKIGPNAVQSSEFNAGHVLIFKVLRSISSVVLLGISAYELGTQTDLVHISLLCFYIYATFLSFISHSAPTRSWRTVATKHVATLYIAVFVIYAYRSLKQLATYENGARRDGRAISWVRFGLLGIAGALVPLFSPRLFVSTPSHTISNPAETASYFSLLTFSYLDRIIMMAYRTPHLGLDQLPHLSEKNTSSFLTAKAFPLIDPVVVNYKNGHIFWRLLKVLRWDYLIMVLYNIALSLINFVAPLSLKKLLEYLEGNNTEGAIRPWIWLVLIALGPITASITEQQLLIFATRVMVRTEAVLTQLVFEHSLRIRLSVPAEHKKSEQEISPIAKVTPTAHVLSEAALEAEEDAVSTVLVTEPLTSESTQTRTEGPAAGKAKDSLIATMTNLITTDLGVIKIPSGYILDPPFAVVQVLLAVGFLYVILGWSALLGALTIIISIPVPTLLGKLIMKTQKEKMEYTDKRLRIVTQNINVMRMIKLFAWESKVETQIFEQREKELRMVRKGRIYDNIAMFLQGLLPLSTMVITYATYTLVMKQELTASIVFSSMAVFGMLRGTIQHTFWTAPTFLRAKVSLDRFNDFFAKAELLKSLESADIETTPDVTLDEEIKFYPSTHTWNKHDHYGDVATTSAGHRFVLRIEEELTFQHGAINLILGPTASGKSSVLMALLGEMYSNARDGGRSYVLPRDGGIAYAAQESWVFNDTIRNNIIFNEAFDQDRYTNVIEQCALELDISRFETGDLTEIGEKGITLSGGQKARITLARAVYSSAQTLLLDDVLSALDVHTAKWIVEKCFQGTLIKGRTVLLVTHNVALVAPAANFAVELSSDGHVLHQGPLKEIMRKTSLLKEAEKELETQEKATLLDGDAAAAKEVDESQKGKLIIAEEIALGRVAWPAIRLYTHSVGGPLFWMTLVGGLYLALVLSAFQVWFLGYWASQYTGGDNVSVPVAKFLGVFTLIATVGSAAFSITAIFYVFGKIRASRSIHAKLITSILRAPLRWLDTVPLARIISRCTTDMEIIDDTLGNELWNLIGLAAMLSVSLAAVIYIAGWRAAVLGVVVATIGFGFGIIYLKAQLCIKRENSNARSPVISHFQAALGGLVSIRAYGMETAFKAISRERIDKYIRSSLIQYDLNRWIAVRSDTLGGIFSGLIGAYLVYGGRQTFAAGDVGFALNQILSFSQTLLYLVRIYNMFEVEANSVERIYDFLVIDQEPLPTEVCKPPAYWPASGNLVIKNLSAQYSKDGPFVLQDVSFDIKSVGRTGAGKSTLALALLRGIPTSGEVFYDGMDTAKLNLDALRSSITLIPQQPELIAGSLRENIDPFSQYDDATLNDALHSAGLYDISSSLTHSSPQNITLDTQIDAGGSNFSLGQRQIVALARALLRKCKVLLLDEATASIDHTTDEVIQRSIRTELSKDTTVITIAHRLQSIMDSDRVIVLDGGRLVEFDSPSVLLRREHSLLKDLVDESIDHEKLRKMAGL